MIPAKIILGIGGIHLTRKGNKEVTTKEAMQIMKKWYKMGTDGHITGLTEEDDRLGYLDGWFTRDDKEAFNLAINVLCVIDQIKWERDMALEQLEKIKES